MKRCIVISADRPFLRAIAAALEAPAPQLASSPAQARSCLAEGEVRLVLADGQHSPAGTDEFLRNAATQYPDTWFVTTGDAPSRDILHVDAPVTREALSFFLENDPAPRPEPADEDWIPRYTDHILPILLEHFWTGLLNGWILSDRTTILIAGRHDRIPYLENMRILPVLVKTTHISKVEESIAKASRTHLYFADLLNRHLVIHPLGGTALDRFSQKWAVLIYLDAYPCTPEEMALRCESAAAEAGKQDWQLTFCIGDPVEPAELLDQWNRLEALSEEEIGYRSSILYAGQRNSIHQVAPMPDLQALNALLARGQFREAEHWVRDRVISLAEQNLLDAPWLNQFRDELLPCVYSALQHHGIPAEQVLTQDLLNQEYQRAASGVQLLINWFHRIVDRIDRFLREELADTPVKKAQKYILQHLDQELSREEIAAHLYISSGYLGRLFKRELNVNLSEYVFLSRMKLAAQMLEQTSLSITEIAMRVGISNFPYFSTQFKKYSGLTPVEYRRKNRKEP